MDKQEETPTTEPKAPVAEPQESAVESQAPVAEPQESAAEPQAAQKAPRFTTVKILLLAYIIDALLYTAIVAILTPLGLTNGNTISSDNYLSTIVIVITLAVSVYLSYLIITNYNRKKYGNNYRTEKISKEAGKRAGKIVILTLILSVTIAAILIMLSLFLTTQACNSMSASYCVLGWIWGFFMVPGSVLLSFTISPFLAAFIVKKTEPKDS